MRPLRMLGGLTLLVALSLVVLAAACGDDDDDDIGDAGDIIGTVESEVDDAADDVTDDDATGDDGNDDIGEVIGDELDDIRDEIVEEITEVTEDEITGVEIDGDTAILATTLTDEAVAREVCEETLGLAILPASEVIVEDESGVELARCS